MTSKTSPRCIVLAKLSVSRVERIPRRRHHTGSRSPERQAAGVVHRLPPPQGFRNTQQAGLHCPPATSAATRWASCRLSKRWTPWSAWGASIGMGLGLRHTLPEAEARRVVSVIGDSTFVHSGITGLVEMAYNRPSTGHVVLLLDNSTTAMTGLQEHAGTGPLTRSPTGSPA